MEECKEQKLKIESLSHVYKATELDSKANRYMYIWYTYIHVHVMYYVHVLIQRNYTETSFRCEEI